jgi:putative acetyltransferase
VNRSGPAIRRETAADREAIFAVQESAFGRRDEAELVDALRDAGAASLSLVAEEQGRVVGHILFSPVVVRDGGAEWGALGLAPLAVTPERQRAGVGSALVHAGLEACRLGGAGVVFVLGHPHYYPRFGFRPAAALGLRWEQPGHEAAFFVAEVLRDALRGRRGMVSYHPAFERVR